MKRILQYIRPFYLYMAFTMLIKFIGTVMELLIPRLLEIMLDVAVPQENRNSILFRIRSHFRMFSSSGPSKKPG